MKLHLNHFTSIESANLAPSWINEKDDINHQACIYLPTVGMGQNFKSQNLLYNIAAFLANGNQLCYHDINIC